jgi:hypothetical protein
MRFIDEYSAMDSFSRTPMHNAYYLGSNTWLDIIDDAWKVYAQNNDVAKI